MIKGKKSQDKAREKRKYKRNKGRHGDAYYFNCDDGGVEEDNGDANGASGAGTDDNTDGTCIGVGAFYGYLSNFATGFQKVPFFLKIDQNQWFQNSRFHFYLVFI